MNHHMHRTLARDVQTAALLRRNVRQLQQDMDRFARSFAAWQQHSRWRERQAEARFHVIEAQLARITGSGTMGTTRSCPVAPPAGPQPVVFPIAAYRTR